MSKGVSTLGHFTKRFAASDMNLLNTKIDALPGKIKEDLADMGDVGEVEIQVKYWPKEKANGKTNTKKMASVPVERAEV